MRNRWFNYRPLFLMFAFLICGSLFLCYYDIKKMLSIVIASCVLILLIVVSIISKNPKYTFIPLLSFMAGVGCFYLAKVNFETVEMEKPQYVNARIYKIEKKFDDCYRMFLDDCKVNGKTLDSNIYLYMYDYSNRFESVEIGRYVQFKPSSYKKMDLKAENGLINSDYFEENLKVKMNVNIEKVTFGQIKLNLSENLKDKVQKNLHEGLSNENAELTYSALFGDKTNLSSAIYSSFRSSGVAHLLAVSGLHVGVIVGVLDWILKKCRVKNWPKLLIISAMLIAYAYLCGFAVSIVRASIMSICLLLGPLILSEYDGISSLSLAGIIVFLLNPFCIFDISFLMSFSCIFGICFMMKPIQNILRKWKFPEWLSSSLAMSLSTSVSLMIIFAYFFNKLNLITLLANIILIPLFSVAFSVIFVVAILSLIWSKFVIVLMPINYILSFINLVSFTLGNLSWANLLTTAVPFVSIFIYFMILLILGRMCTATTKQKVAVTLPLASCLIVLMVL